MTSLSTADWTTHVHPLEACGVLSNLPPLSKLIHAANVWLTESQDQSPDSPSAAFAQPLFRSQQLYDALYDCLSLHPGLPPESRTPSALLLASLAMEQYVRAHSTRARLRAAVRARAARAAAAAVALAPTASTSSDPGASPVAFATPTPASTRLPHGPDDPTAAAATADGADASDLPAEGDDEDPDGLVVYFRSHPPAVVAERLREVLGEPPHLTASLQHVVERHNPADLARIVRNTRLACASGEVQRMDGGKRTLGGIFFHQVKRLKAQGIMAAVQQQLPALPPLRPYQRDVVGMVLTSWGLEVPREAIRGADGDTAAAGVAGAGAAAAALPSGAGAGGAAALQARWTALAHGWRQNWLVASPTNSGKTRMMIEIARGLVESRQGGRGALVVVLVPNVVLTSQIATEFERSVLPRTVAAAHSSNRPLSSGLWQEALRTACGGLSRVMVCTAESFHNLLKFKTARMEHLSLLVFDEVHHCKDDHPYAQIMKHYDTRPEAAAAMPRVLGLTASPASETNQSTLFLRMDELLRRLGACLHSLDSDDPGVAAAMPDPTELERPVRMRRVDTDLIGALQGFALDAAIELGESLEAARTEGPTAAADKAMLQLELEDAAYKCAAVSTGSSQGRPQQAVLVTRLDPLGQWLGKGREFAAKYGCPCLELHCRFLDIMRKTIELVEDAGFEGALPFLARKAAALCRQEQQALGAPLGTCPPPLAPCPPPTIHRYHMVTGALEAAAAAAAAASAAAASSSSTPSRPGASRQAASAGGGAGRAGSREPSMLAALRTAAAAAALPGVPQQMAPGAAGGRWGDEDDEGDEGDGGEAGGARNRCPDVELRVSTLLRSLLTGTGGVQFLSTPQAADMVRDCFLSGELQERSTFPKYWALVDYLQKYRHKETFHGIIFVKTRQAVFHLADMMHRTQQLHFVEVLEIIGQNSSAGKRSALAGEHDRHGRGMSDTEQQQVVRIFKEPGRKVLVATSTAEEGIDVPSCEFVVRYNAAATGIQLRQSRGRARVQASEFVSILQEDTLDVRLHSRSQQQEANMTAYHQQHRRG